MHYATFGKNDSAFLNFFQDNAKPVLAKYEPNDEINLIYLGISISEKGEVVDVEFFRIDLNEECTNELLSVFLNMGKWIPACRNNKPVISKRLFKIEY